MSGASLWLVHWNIEASLLVLRTTNDRNKSCANYLSRISRCEISSCMLLSGRLSQESTAATHGLISVRLWQLVVVIRKWSQPLSQALMETHQSRVFVVQLLRGGRQLSHVVARATQYRHLGHAHVSGGALYHGAQSLEAVLEVVSPAALQHVVVRTLAAARVPAAMVARRVPRRRAAVRVVGRARIPRRRGRSRSATDRPATVTPTDCSARGTVQDRRRRRRGRKAAAIQTVPRGRHIGRRRRTLRGRVDISTWCRRWWWRCGRRSTLTTAAAVVVHGRDSGQQGAGRRQHEQVSHERHRSAGGDHLRSSDGLQPQPRWRRHGYHVHLITRLVLARRCSRPCIFLFYSTNTHHTVTASNIHRHFTFYTATFPNSANSNSSEILACMYIYRSL